LPERRQIQMFDGRMIARPVTIGFHPDMLTRIQIDGGDASVRRFEQRKTAWPGHEFPSTVFESQVGAASITGGTIRRESTGDRRHIQNSGLGIESGTIPVCAAHRAGQLKSTLRVIRATAFDRGRRVEWADDIALCYFDRLGSQFRREVDEIVDGYSLPLEGCR